MEVKLVQVAALFKIGRETQQEKHHVSNFLYSEKGSSIDTQYSHIPDLVVSIYPYAVFGRYAHFILIFQEFIALLQRTVESQIGTSNEMETSQKATPW